MITTNIELKDRNGIKEFLQNFHSKTEDLLFFIISKTPEKLIPSQVLSWLDRYTTKRINELQQQVIKQRWTQNALEQAVNDIRSQKQDMKKAHPED